MDLPSFVPFPPANLRRDIAYKEWKSCLDAWFVLAEAYLLLPTEIFLPKLSKDPSIPEFLSSYMEAIAQDILSYKVDPELNTLRRSCYLLTHRCLSEPKQKPSLLLEWHFLSDLSIIYANNPSLRPLLQGLWQAENLDNRLKKHKVSLISNFEDLPSKNDSSDLEYTLARTAALLRACPAYGQFLMLGSDFIDALSTLYDHVSSSLQKKLVVLSYRCFLALLDPSYPKFLMLLDHLYTMHSSSKQQSLLSKLCSRTPFVRKLRESIAGPEAIRAEKLIHQLAAFEGTGTLASKRKKPTRRKANNGKGKEKDEFGHGAVDERLHVHKMSLITQIQDLFPDLGSGFVVKLLDEYNDDTERVTAHLLDDSLPPHLKALDRSENLPKSPPQPSHNLGPHLSPRTTPPLLPTRRNIHDNDAFDRLTISPSQIHRGLKSSSNTADTILQDRSTAPNKAAILSALAAFDSDDDERDDTYDVEDVGGTVDTAIPGSDEVDADLRDKNEEALFRAWKMSPEVFERDAATRRGKPRMALKSETGMTDEAVEGWGIMVGRDPRRLRRLEARFEVFGGQQRGLVKTRWREGEATTDESDRAEGSGSGSGRGRGGFRGRGRGTGRGGGAGGNVAGLADEQATQIARQRKDASKGTRANHNRRDQRAKKVARAGFPG
ncbi:MAG: hypothetical protein LQ338_001823 [Usnochroma carphineum]|nr:MAG: hypothetical protein LQ338_001823 [Usnochroma carphineum]